MRFLTTLAAAACLLVGTSDGVQAQNVTVQQPVVSNFSVATTVSVPDGGGAFMGGVKRAGESRGRFGFFGSGSSVGLFRDYSGVSTHVTIHDLRETDRRLLERSSRSEPSGPRMLTGYAAHAYESLLGRTSVRRERGRRQRDDVASGLPTGAPRERAGETSAQKRPSRSEKFDPARLYRLGRRAEQQGKRTVARLHYRLAVRHGSSRAAARLAALEKGRIASADRSGSQSP